MKRKTTKEKLMEAIFPVTPVVPICQYPPCGKTISLRGKNKDQGIKYCCAKHRVAHWNILNPRVRDLQKEAGK